MSANKKKGPSAPRLDADFTEATQLLEGKSQLLDNIMDSIGDGLSIQDKNMRIVYQNKFMIENFGSHIGEQCYKVYEGRDEICEGCPIAEAYRTGKVNRALRVGTTKEGEQYRFENIASLLRNEHGDIVAGIEVTRQVEERERALDELREAAEKLMQAKAVYENSSEGILVVDHANRVVSVNPAFESITGFTAGEVLGTDLSTLDSSRNPPEFYTDMRESLQKTGNWRGELWNRHKDGHLYALSMNVDTVLDENGALKQRVYVFSDITEKKRVEQRIEYMAQYDALTNLPNRTLFADRLEHAAAIARREKSRFALLYLDLDRFKPVNDTFGHVAGDTLLQMVARRLAEGIRVSDTVARLGGDEFAVIIAPVKSNSDATVVAEKLRAELALPFDLGDAQVTISSSIGGAFFPEDTEDEETLLQKADQAMYRAKSSGRNKVCFKTAEGAPR